MLQVEARKGETVSDTEIHIGLVRFIEDKAYTDRMVSVGCKAKFVTVALSYLILRQALQSKDIQAAILALKHLIQSVSVRLRCR
jgi:hypothetical protein